MVLPAPHAKYGDHIYLVATCIIRKQLLHRQFESQQIRSGSAKLQWRSRPIGPPPHTQHPYASATLSLLDLKIALPQHRSLSTAYTISSFLFNLFSSSSLSFSPRTTFTASGEANLSKRIWREVERKAPPTKASAMSFSMQTRNERHRRSTSDPIISPQTFVGTRFYPQRILITYNKVVYVSLLLHTQKRLMPLRTDNHKWFIGLAM